MVKPWQSQIDLWERQFQDPGPAEAPGLSAPDFYIVTTPLGSQMFLTAKGLEKIRRMNWGER